MAFKRRHDIGMDKLKGIIYNKACSANLPSYPMIKLTLAFASWDNLYSL